MYREAGFIDRPGAKKYCIGRIGNNNMEDIIQSFIKNNKIEPSPDDTKYFDAFDHVLTKLLNQSEADINFGIPIDKGPINFGIDNTSIEAPLIEAFYRSKD